MRATKAALAAAATACVLVAVLPAPALATHWSGSGSLSPLVAFSGEVVRFTFVVNNSAPEPLQVFAVKMVACWHGPGGGTYLKPDDGTSVNVSVGGALPIVADVDVPPLPPGLCHTAVVVQGQTPADGSPGYGDYHFDVNYSSRPALALNLTASPLDGEPPLEANFTVSAGGGTPPYAYEWAFGDGSNATGAAVAHRYATVGRFNATVVATDAAGTRASAAATVWVHSGLAVNATARPAQGDAPLSVALQGSAVGAFGDATFAWQFGDGQNGPGVNATHVYAVPGNYTAVLTVTDAAGAEANATVGISVFVPFVVHVSVAPEGGAAGTTFHFAAREEGAQGAVSYHWIFGDGAVALGEQSAHAFGGPGVYVVYVHATDSATGRFVAANTTVEVKSAARPAPGFEGAGAVLAAVGASGFAELGARRRRPG